MPDNDTPSKPSVSASASSTGASASASEASASFDFSASIGLSAEEFEAMWQAVSAKVETSVVVTDSDTVEQEARYWDQLEHWLLKDYSRQVKTLALQVARLELMMRTYNVALEARFSASFDAWAKHFDTRIDGIMHNVVREIVQREVQTIVVEQRESITSVILEQINSRYTEIINKKVEERVLMIRDEVIAAVRIDLEALIITKLETFQLTVQDTIISQVIKHISNSVTVLIKQQVTEINIEQFMAVFRVEINRLQSLIIEIENNLHVRIDHGDLRLRNWVVAQLLQIKGCLSDRHVLAELFGEFSTLLRTRLDATDCVDPKRWSDGMIDPVPSLPPRPLPEPPPEVIPNVGPVPDPEAASLACDRMLLVPDTTTAGSAVDLIGPIPTGLRPEDVLIQVPGAEPFHATGVSARSIQFEVPEGAQTGDLVVRVGASACKFTIRVVSGEGPFVGPVASGQGLVGNVYELPANTSKLPDLAKLEPITSVAVANLDVPEREFKDGFPGVAKGGSTLVEWFAIRFAGKLKIADAGEYRFRVTSDDGAIVYLNNNEIINNDGVHSPVAKTSATLKLSVGSHAIRVDYFQGPRYKIALRLEWMVPGAKTYTVVPPEAFARDLG